MRYFVQAETALQEVTVYQGVAAESPERAEELFDEGEGVFLQSIVGRVIGEVDIEVVRSEELPHIHAALIAAEARRDMALRHTRYVHAENFITAAFVVFSLIFGLGVAGVFQ